MYPTVRLKTKLWTHQEKLVADAQKGFEDFGYWYWYSGCGTGKTLASIELMRKMWQEMDVNFVLVLSVKATLETVWGNDIRQNTEGFRTLVLDKGTSTKKLEKLERFYETLQEWQSDSLREDRPIFVVVVNYETAKLLPLEQFPFDLAIADEGHRLSGHNSQLSLILSKSCSRIPYKLLMTGTAFADNLHQVFGQFRWLNPELYTNPNTHTGCKLFGHWNDFLDEHYYTYTRDNIRIPTKCRNVQKLMKRINPYMTRIRREDVIDLPTIHHVKRYFRLLPKNQKTYDAMESDKVAYIKNADGSDGIALAQYEMTQNHRLHQLTRGWYVDFESKEITKVKGSSESIDATIVLLEELGSDPVVIFTSYREDVALLSEAIGKALPREVVLQLTGAVDQHASFQSGKGNILLANLQAGSTGVRLHRAKYIIYYGLSPSTARTDYLQSIERVHRHGQDSEVTVFHIVCENSIDEDAYALLNKKEKVEVRAEVEL